jgi:hypothetical protein
MLDATSPLPLLLLAKRERRKKNRLHITCTAFLELKNREAWKAESDHE